MSTIDGKITSGTGVDILEDYFSLYTKTEDQLQTKAWMIGRVTMQMFADDPNIVLPESNEEVSNEDFISKKQSDYYMFALDTKGSLRWKTNTITLSNVSEKLNLVVVVTSSTPKEYLSYLKSKDISYVFGGEEEINFESLFIKIKKLFELDKIVVEGGGILNGSIMSEDLIDEVSLLVTPIVLNKTDSPSMFERKNVNEIKTKQYKLQSVEKLENDCVWLRYQK